MSAKTFNRYHYFSRGSRKKPCSHFVCVLSLDGGQISPGVGLFLLPVVVIVTMVTSFLPKVSDRFELPNTSDTLECIETQGGRCCMMLFWLVLAIEAGKGGSLV